MATMEDVIQFLKSQERANPSGDGRQVMMRCPVCGDPTSPTSANFSVLIDTSEHSPLFYQCFRASCQASGIITTEFLQKYFGCNDISLLLALNKYNNDKDGIKKVKKVGVYNTPPKLSLKLEKSSIAKEKVKYFNLRLGTNLTLNELTDLKVICDLPQFYYRNKLRPSKVMYYNGRNAIGFLSGTNDTIICRNMEPNNIVGRYFNERIKFNTKDYEYHKYYIVPGSLDLMSPEATEINIAEGVFSILGAYFYQEKMLKNKYRGNRIFVANSGSGYYRTITAICKRYGMTDIILNIYSDSEIPPIKYEDLRKKLKKEFVEIEAMNIIYNIRKEDFGYPVDNIETKIYKLK